MGKEGDSRTSCGKQNPSLFSGNRTFAAPLLR
ncbi:hypothetical protein CGRA01v4_08637 [Colletotrichum graminicola]|nr:hypothetical protein CGRA01v4_08637 [Colletotrichum graminicola]